MRIKNLWNINCIQMTVGDLESGVISIVAMGPIVLHFMSHEQARVVRQKSKDKRTLRAIFLVVDIQAKIPALPSSQVVSDV